MEDEILKINAFLNKQNRCGFEVIDFNQDLRIGGRSNVQENYAIIILFQDVYFMDGFHSWQVNTNIDSFSIPSLEEQKNMQMQYSVEEGYVFFKIIPEDIKPEILINAKKLKIEFLNY